MQLFRPRLHFMVSEVIVALIAMLCLVAWSFLRFEDRSNAYAAALALVALWLLVVGGYVWTQYWIGRRLWLQLDEEAISGMLGDGPFHIAWKEVLAVSQRKEIIRQGSFTIFYLTTEQKMYVIPLNQNFDTGQIWRLIQAAVSQEALASDAYQNLPDYQSWLEEQTKALNEQSLPLQVWDQPLFRVIGWLGLIFCLTLAVTAWRTEGGVIALFFVLLALMGLYLILRYGRTQLDATHITRITPLGTYQIGWEEINRVEFYGSQTIVFRSSHKSLVIPGAVSMATINQDEMMRYIKAQILGRELATGQASFWARSKNTKIRRDHITH